MATKPIEVAEISDTDRILAPKIGVADEGALYRTALIPVGRKAEVIIRIDGKIMSTDSWVAVPKSGFNSALEVRIKVFDDSEAETLKAKIVKSEIL